MFVSLHHLPGLAGGLLALPCLWLSLRHAPTRGRWRAADPLTRLAVALLAVAGGIHLGLVPGHAGDLGRQLLFAFNALAFGGCAVLALRANWWRWPAGGLLVATIAPYLFSIGRGQEEIDQVGMISKLVELLALGLVLAPHRGGRRRRAFRWGGAAAGLVFATFVVGTVGYAAELRPGTGHVHAGASGPPMPAQRAAADALWRDTTAGIARYQDPSRALADGYRPAGPQGSSSHWTNPRYERNGPILDPRRPQALVYANARGGPVLLGAMFESAGPGQAGPQPGGTLTTWHTHDNICISVLGGFQVAGMMSPFGSCPVGTFSVHTRQMMHVWTAPNPNGPFGELDENWVKRLDAA